MYVDVYVRRIHRERGTPSRIHGIYMGRPVYVARAAAASISLMEYQIERLFSENVDRASIVRRVDIQARSCGRV